jgi:hypothetical protein
MSEDHKDGHQDTIISVRYEAYPFPPRDPADETTRLITGSPSFRINRFNILDHFPFPDHVPGKTS